MGPVSPQQVCERSRRDASSARATLHAFETPAQPPVNSFLKVPDRSGLASGRRGERVQRGRGLLASEAATS